MEKIKAKIMDLNKETAMRLWSKYYGKETKVKDFTGREIAKGAYNDRNSEYGWNVDHILPQSRGGKTADYNLIICHILTNDEKADKFPAFKANDKKYEIVKVENHYEIKPIVKNSVDNNIINDKPNFYDSAFGIRLYKKLKSMQNKHPFVGSICIQFRKLCTTALIDFIKMMFDSEEFDWDFEKKYPNDNGNNDVEITKIIIRNFDLPQKNDIQNLLDKCILLNTYCSHYFKKNGTFTDYEIRFRVDNYDDKKEAYMKTKNVNLIESYNENDYLWGMIYSTKPVSHLNNTFYINRLVAINTDAENKVKDIDGWILYNYIYPNLAKNLEKEASK